MNILSKRQDYLHKVTKGYEKMRESKIAICALARDCESDLIRILPEINRLRNCFASSHVIVVENDSKDGTKKILSQLSTTVENVHILSEDFGVRTVPEGKQKSLNPYYSCRRIELMAGFRNKYLEYLETLGEGFDYVIMIDLDLYALSLDGIANTFGQFVKWHAVGSYGKYPTNKGYRYYDTYAFYEESDSTPQNLSKIFTYQNVLSGMTKGMPLLRVGSVFSGLTIYEAQAIDGLRYRCEPNNDPEIEAVCEHITFHEDMRKNGNGLIFINPSQELYYNTYCNKYFGRIFF